MRQHVMVCTSFKKEVVRRDAGSHPADKKLRALRVGPLHG